METLATTEAVAPLFPGYEITRQLGRGSSSTVWLGTRLGDGTRFALKCPRREAQAELLGNAAREVMLLSHLKHQHIVRVHEVLQPADGPPGTLGIVMDYAAGGSLANLVSGRQRLSIGETVTVLTPIAQALAYLHSHGVVHGDVSPGNVLLTAVGMPLLADLGLAARVGDPEQRHDVGTAGFRDPYVPAITDDGDQELRPQRDVFSLGAIGWYCLTGVVPETTQLRPPLSLLVPEVPKSLAAALEAALDPDPLVRPTAKEFGSAVFRSAAPQTVDLSGAVHRSVIPELLTRREAHGRPPRRAGFGIRWRGRDRVRRALQGVRQKRARPASKMLRKTTFTRLALLLSVVAVGAVIGGLALNRSSGWIQERSTPADPPVSRLAASDTTAQATQTAVLPVPMDGALQTEDPALAVEALSALRDSALREGRLELLEAVNAQGSPAAESDRKLSAQLRESGTRLDGLTTRLSGLEVGPSTTLDHVDVDVTATTSAYAERDADGTVVRTAPAGAARELRLSLVRADGRWWLSEITAPGH
ncbi:serine/threonine protein kinase [Paenarthrobacter sp. NPDC057355]|uniref:serine/threonine protein kinase n=1 Tax=Paenarthrobacter sp. NPDC057355 TaxID=3346105 RepID=UPI003639B101